MFKLLELLSEVFDTYYNVKERDMTVPEKGATKGIAIFHAENKKFIIEAYQYPNDFYLFSYYPKLNIDFHKSPKQPNKYRIQLNLKNPYKVLGTVFKYMKDVTIKNPKASVGFYGAPDVEDGDPNFSMYMSKRYRIYNQMIKQFNFLPTHDFIRDPNLSSVILLNKQKLTEVPDLLDYANQYMDQAIN